MKDACAGARVFFHMLKFKPKFFGHLKIARKPTSQSNDICPRRNRDKETRRLSKAK